MAMLIPAVVVAMLSGIIALFSGLPIYIAILVYIATGAGVILTLGVGRALRKRVQTARSSPKRAPSQIRFRQV
jgi:membrane protein implicated in regulation of membrane protease activity